MTTFLVEKEPGFGETAQGVTVPGKIDKMGYKGVDTTEMVFEGHRISADQILGGEPGKGFYQMMDGVEVGRVNVAARACGIANRAFELGIAYAQQRETFGKPIAQHQAILFRLAEMATKVETAHAMMVQGRPLKDAGERNDVEAGMAKMLASEYCNEVVQDSFRIHGGYGYSKEYEIERLYREAAFMLIGEGTSDIQKMIIGRALLKDYQLPDAGRPAGEPPRPAPASRAKVEVRHRRPGGHAMADNDDLKAKMREALDRKQAHDQGVPATARSRRRRTAPRSSGARPRCTAARPAAAAPEPTSAHDVRPRPPSRRRCAP